ncbi:MAG: fibronectin type III domain-containing protein, partial [Kiritimatiellota bacterium]|nr:fibronectin type III domain-containing protein [Kiritimatiellota bacterium]
DNPNYHKINQTWLDAQLSANTQPHVFVFGHEPAFQAHASSTCLSTNLLDRNLFWDSIGNANTRAYITGHSHVYGRCLASISNGPALRQIIAGTGGAVLEWWWNGEYDEPAGSGALIVPETNCTPANTYGYSIVRVSGNHVEMIYKSTSITNLTTWTTNDVFAYTIAATPTNVHASDGDYTDKVLVSWSPAADAIGYEVWRGTNASAAVRARIGVATNTSFSDTAAVPAVLYYYWVKATNAFGSSVFSSSDSGWRAGRADPAMVDRTGNWYVWFSGSGYQMGGPWNLGVLGTPVAADYDGDRYADPAMVDSTGAWRVWFTSLGYQMGGPYSLGVLGTPVAGDFDGDHYADPAMVDNAGAWCVWYTSLGYQMGGPWNLGVSGTPVAGDFDGDRYTDCAIVDNAGAWRVWFTSAGYQMGGPWNLGVSGMPVAADFDGDEYADPAVVDNNAVWYVWFTSLGYQMGGPYYLGGSGTPVAADFEGDR